MSELEEDFAGQLRILRVKPEPVREYEFARYGRGGGIERNWRFDFAWVGIRLAVELEGGTWKGGAHTRGLHFKSDAEKYNAAALLGWRVLRYDTDQVADWSAARELAAIIGREYRAGSGSAPVAPSRPTG